MACDRSLIHNLSLFHDMEPADLSRLLMLTVIRRYLKNDIVFEQGAEPAAFYLLLDGRLKVSQVTPDGQQVMVGILHPGDMFGLDSAFAGSNHSGTAHSAVDSIVVSWSMADWDAVIGSCPRLATNAMQTICQRLDEAQTRLRELSTLEVEPRLANSMLRLIEKAGRVEGGCTCIDFPLTRQDIAEMNGTTMHTVSRIFSSWEAKGLVEGRHRKLMVLDPAGLARIADPVN